MAAAISSTIAVLGLRRLAHELADARRARHGARARQDASAQRRCCSGLDLHVPAGQFLAIVGRSGCGKSTLLRLIAGLDAPDAGRIAFADEPRGGADGRARHVSGAAAAALGARARQCRGRARRRARPSRRRAAARSQALEAVGLADRADEWPSVLSGGQKQRVALARALVSRPRLLALDEPLGALDALTRIEMQRLLERVWLKERFTAILVTHDVGEAIALADRIVLIENGGDRARPRSTCRARATAASRAFGALEEQILQRLLGEAR